MRKIRLNDKGFTIVELLIATAIFSVVLLLCSVAAVQIGRTFYKGVLINRVQDTARKVVEDVSQSVQFGINAQAGFSRSGGTPGDTETRCLGEVRYTFNTKASLGNNGFRHVLWKDRVSSTDGCKGQAGDKAIPNLMAALIDGQELLGDNMRVPNFGIFETPFNSVISWTINVTISYGNDDDLFESGSNFSKCVSRRIGGQFCAVSSINTLIEKRL